MKNPSIDTIEAAPLKKREPEGRKHHSRGPSSTTPKKDGKCSTSLKEGERESNTTQRRERKHHHQKNEQTKQHHSSTTTLKKEGGRRWLRKEEEAAPPTCFPWTTRQKQARWKTKSTSWLDMTPVFVAVCFPKIFFKNKILFQTQRTETKEKWRKKSSEIDKVHLAASREGPNGRKSKRNPSQTEYMTCFKTVIIILPSRKVFLLLSLFRCWKGQINVFECFSNSKNIQTVTPLPTSVKPKLNNEKIQVENLEFKNITVLRIFVVLCTSLKINWNTKRLLSLQFTWDLRILCGIRLDWKAKTQLKKTKWCVVCVVWCCVEWLFNLGWFDLGWCVPPPSSFGWCLPNFLWVVLSSSLLWSGACSLQQKEKLHLFTEIIYFNSMT